MPTSNEFHVVVFFVCFPVRVLYRNSYEFSADVVCEHFSALCVKGKLEGTLVAVLSGWGSGDQNGALEGMSMKSMISTVISSTHNPQSPPSALVLATEREWQYMAILTFEPVLDNFDYFLCSFGSIENESYVCNHGSMSYGCPPAAVLNTGYY